MTKPGTLASSLLSNVDPRLGAGLVSAAGNVATQGISVATGLQRKFDWRGIAAAGVGSAFGDAISGKMGDFADTVLGRTFTGLANGGMQSAIMGQSPNWGAIAASSFGNAVGEELKGAMSGPTLRERAPGKTSDSQNEKQELVPSQSLAAEKEQLQSERQKAATATAKPLEAKSFDDLEQWLSDPRNLSISLDESSLGMDELNSLFEAGDMALRELGRNPLSEGNPPEQSVLESSIEINSSPESRYRKAVDDMGQLLTGRNFGSGVMDGIVRLRPDGSYAVQENGRFTPIERKQGEKLFLEQSAQWEKIASTGYWEPRADNTAGVLLALTLPLGFAELGLMAIGRSGAANMLGKFGAAADIVNTYQNFKNESAKDAAKDAVLDATLYSADSAADTPPPYRSRMYKTALGVVGLLMDMEDLASQPSLKNPQPIMTKHEREEWLRRQGFNPIISDWLPTQKE